MEDREYDEYFDKIFAEHCKGREDHEFVHYNHSMGMQIYGKEHYKSEMKKRKMVPYAETEKLAEEYDKANPRQEYDNISPGSMQIIQALKLTADKNGNIQLGGRAIKALQEVGAIKPRSEYIPDEVSLSGGFNE